MSDTIGLVGTPSGVTSAQTPAAPQASAANTQSTSFNAQISPAPAAASSSASTSKVLTRTIVDPYAGVIVQNISSNGDEIVSQVPSSAVVAYLQDGLTSNGQSPPPAPTAKSTTSTVA